MNKKTSSWRSRSKLKLKLEINTVEIFMTMRPASRNITPNLFMTHLKVIKMMQLRVKEYALIITNSMMRSILRRKIKKTLASRATFFMLWTNYTNQIALLQAS